MNKLSLHLSSGALHLGRGDLLVLEGAAGYRLNCLEGLVLVTEPNRRREIELRPGDSHAIASGGKVLADAWGEARVRLTAVE